jgi:hypothetical protein
MQTPSKGAVLFAAVAGMVDAGLEIPHSDGILPIEERLNGGHINDSVKGSVDSVKAAIDGGEVKKAPKKKAEEKEAKKAPKKKSADDAVKKAPKKKVKEAE